MPKNKNLARILRFFKVYGMNAVLGFGLGVTIVFFSLTILGRYGLGEGSETPKRPVNPAALSSDSQPSEATPSAESQSSQTTSDEENPLAKLGEPLKNSRFTLLLVGTDNRPGESYLSNTDTLVVASIDQVNHRIALLSIPRDTQVNLPGHGVQKMNAVARLQKGLPSTEKQIEQLIGMPMDGYVMTNFSGFKSIVDSLGGITLTVEKDMKYDTGDQQDRYINLKKGTQRLNGTQALQYARFRNDEMADISRTSRQQAVLKAILVEATQLKNLPKIPFVIPKIYQSVQTNLNISQLWSLASLLNQSGEFQAVSQTLPGNFAIEQGISYWKVNSNLSKKVVSQLFYQGKTTPIFTRIGESSSASAIAASPSQSISEEKGNFSGSEKSFENYAAGVNPKQDLLNRKTNEEKNMNGLKESKPSKQKNEKGKANSTAKEKNQQEIQFEVLEN